MSSRYTSELVRDNHGKGSLLGKPLQFPFSGRTASNRIMKAAMTEHLASWNPTDRALCGIPGPELAQLYRRWGEGGAGIILNGNVITDPASLEAKGNMIVPLEARFPSSSNTEALSETDQARFDGYREEASAGKAHGSLMVAQVGHPGRQATIDINPNPVSASAVEIQKDDLGQNMKFGKPHAATLEEIKYLVESFIHCAEYLEAAGFDGIELHAAHGYLLAQFLSQRTNHRTDEYGGTLERRCKIIVDIARGIRSRCSHSFILGIKLNSVEFQEKGLSPEESALICQILEEEKFDFVELSGGTYEKYNLHHSRESTRKREGFFLEFAEQILPAVKQTKVFVTGGFRTAVAIEDVLQKFDGIGIGRPMAQEPDLAKDLINGKVEGAKRLAGVAEDDFLTTAAIAGAQMRAMGEGREPFDGSRVEEIGRFREALGKWVEVLKCGRFESYPSV